MRILELNLLAFGPFTNTRIDLSEGREGLHVVYGPNEAGKSSALRALKQMLFGIPERSGDDFVHPYGKMRIGGTLQHSDGSLMGCIRRKGRAGTLRCHDDKEVLEDGVFKKFLGNIDSGLFETMFGIGHEDLVRGGEEILQGGGNVGQALFAAGSGIVDLRKVQTALQGEADALFRPAAPTRRINEAIARLRKNQKATKEAQLPSQEWARHDQALRDALERRAAVDVLLGQRQRDMHRLNRIQEALPLISRRKELLTALEAYGSATLLPDEFGERRRRLVTELRVAENDKEQASQAVEEIIKELKALEVPEKVLENGGLIERMYQDLGSYQKAAKDRIQLATKRDMRRTEATDILSGLRQDLTIEEAEKLKLQKTETVRIQKLGSEYERLVTRLEGVSEEISKLAALERGVQEELGLLEAPKPVEALLDAVDKAGKYASLEEHYVSESAEIRTVRESLESALAKQSFWSGTLEDLEPLPLPSPENIDVFEKRFSDAEGALSKVTSVVEDTEAEMLEIEGKIEGLRLEREVPTEEDLEEARRKRERGWFFVRSAWQESRENPEEVAEFVQSVHGSSLADAYERCVRQADDLADRLRREAERVATKAKLLADRETKRAQLDRLKNQTEVATRHLADVDKDWEALWEPCGIRPRTPREMRAWWQVQHSLCEESAKLRHRKAKADDLKTRIEAHRRELGRRLGELSEEPGEDQESLSELIERAKRFMKRQEALRRKREQLLADKSAREQELREARSRGEKIEEALTRWQGLWEDAVRPLGLRRESLPEEATAVLDELKELFDKTKEADILQKRIKGIDRDAEAFRRKVGDLVDRVAEDLVDLSPEHQVSELHARLQRGRTTQARVEGLEKQRDKQRQRLEAAETAMASMTSKLKSMCEEAGCVRHEELPEAERRSSARRKMEEELEGLEKQLRKLSGGATIDAFLEDADTVDPDGLESQVQRLGEEVEKLAAERSRLDQSIGEERNELRKMDGSAQAAELAEETQKILARLETDVEHYARLRLASAVLARAIERYREKHQDPILRKANELFGRLTRGAFEGIRAEFDDQGVPVLVGVRPGGKGMVGVEGMSDGTTDQLYLALRLASLETYLDGNEPMPFIVDDILIKFDNDRATAALQVLADLSKKTQVIFFTHHRHLVALAEANVDSSVLFKHALGA
jgi:uncharacterized protein YhaN